MLYVDVTLLQVPCRDVSAPAARDEDERAVGDLLHLGGLGGHGVRPALHRARPAQAVHGNPVHDLRRGVHDVPRPQRLQYLHAGVHVRPAAHHPSRVVLQGGDRTVEATDAGQC
jgi:hypothetical protein